MHLLLGGGLRLMGGGANPTVVTLNPGSLARRQAAQGWFENLARGSDRWALNDPCLSFVELREARLLLHS